MTATAAEARVEIQTTVNVAWLADASSQNLPLLWEDKPEAPPDSGAWARVTLRHATGRQATLRGATGERRFRRTGTLTVQIFTPHGEGLTLNDTLSKIITDALEGVTTASGVIFRDVRPNEIGPDGKWYQTNVLAGFEYDEVR